MWPRRPNPAPDDATPSEAAARRSRYRVAKSEEGWHVLYDDAPIDRFDDGPSAVAFACGLARAEAQMGVVATVVVDGPVNEIHHFQMPQAGGAPQP